jgi:hypothetical protein
MGATGWKVRLSYKGLNVTSFHRDISKLAGSKGFRCEPDLQPWSQDGRALALLTWDAAPVFIYEVDGKTVRPVPWGSEFVRSVQWSPTTDRLLITSSTRALLVDRAATPQGAATWRIPQYEQPYANWMRDGRWFWTLARESVSAKVKLTFYAVESGAHGEAHDLDPGDVAPYDAEKFASLPRLRYSLVITPSHGAVGQLLDTWHEVQFHQPSDTLYLAVYRPVSDIYEKENELRCDVQERWFAVRLE